jgi:pimeloyl-ACP methyl ester carboxylesterase
MTTYVLIPGACHGAWCFDDLTAALHDNGHRVLRYTLTGVAERAHLAHAGVNLETHITDVLSALAAEPGAEDLVLVGHSYGGMVITGAADRAPDRVGHLVYLDAKPPRDGQSLVDVAGPFMAAARSDSQIVDGVEMCLFPTDETIKFYGVIDPQTLQWMRARLTPHPWRCFEQPLQLTNEAALQPIRQSHISTTAFMSLRNADKLRQQSDGRVWDIDTGHDLMITEPQKVAELLDGIAPL